MPWISAVRSAPAESSHQAVAPARAERGVAGQRRPLRRDGGGHGVIGEQFQAPARRGLRRQPHEKQRVRLPGRAHGAVDHPAGELRLALPATRGGPAPKFVRGTRRARRRHDQRAIDGDHGADLRRAIGPRGKRLPRRRAGGGEVEREPARRATRIDPGEIKRVAEHGSLRRCERHRQRRRRDRPRVGRGYADPGIGRLKPDDRAIGGVTQEEPPATALRHGAADRRAGRSPAGIGPAARVRIVAPQRSVPHGEWRLGGDERRGRPTARHRRQCGGPDADEILRPQRRSEAAQQHAGEHSCAGHHHGRPRMAAERLGGERLFFMNACGGPTGLRGNVRRRLRI